MTEKAIYQKLAKLVNTSPKILKQITNYGFIAGGSVVYALNNFIKKKVVGDIDIFILNQNRLDLYKILTIIKNNFNIVRCEVNSSCIKIYTKNSTIPLQIILTNGKTIINILDNFDFDYVKCGLHKDKLFIFSMTKKAHKKQRIKYFMLKIFETPNKIKERITKAKLKGFSNIFLEMVNHSIPSSKKYKGYNKILFNKLYKIVAKNLSNKNEIIPLTYVKTYYNENIDEYLSFIDVMSVSNNRKNIHYKFHKFIGIDRNYNEEYTFLFSIINGYGDKKIIKVKGLIMPKILLNGLTKPKTRFEMLLYLLSKERKIKYHTKNTIGILRFSNYGNNPFNKNLEEIKKSVFDKIIEFNNIENIPFNTKQLVNFYDKLQLSKKFFYGQTTIKFTVLSKLLVDMNGYSNSNINKNLYKEFMKYQDRLLVVLPPKNLNNLKQIFIEFKLNNLYNIFGLKHKYNKSQYINICRKDNYNTKYINFNNNNKDKIINNKFIIKEFGELIGTKELQYYFDEIKKLVKHFLTQKETLINVIKILYILYDTKQINQFFQIYNKYITLINKNTQIVKEYKVKKMLYKLLIFTNNTIARKYDSSFFDILMVLSKEDLKYLPNIFQITVNILKEKINTIDLLFKYRVGGEGFLQAKNDFYKRLAIHNGKK